MRIYLVPYPAGGFIDVVTRTVAEGLRERLKTDGTAAQVHELIANWEPLKSVA